MSRYQMEYNALLELEAITDDEHLKNEIAQRMADLMDGKPLYLIILNKADQEIDTLRVVLVDDEYSPFGCE